MGIHRRGLVFLVGRVVKDSHLRHVHHDAFVRCRRQYELGGHHHLAAGPGQPGIDAGICRAASPRSPHRSAARCPAVCRLCRPRFFARSRRRRCSGSIRMMCRRGFRQYRLRRRQRLTTGGGGSFGIGRNSEHAPHAQQAPRSARSSRRFGEFLHSILLQQSRPIRQLVALRRRLRGGSAESGATADLPMASTPAIEPA